MRETEPPSEASPLAAAPRRSSTKPTVDCPEDATHIDIGDQLAYMTGTASSLDPALIGQCKAIRASLRVK